MPHVHVRIVSMPLPPIIDADEMPVLSRRLAEILSHLTGDSIESFEGRTTGLILLSHRSGLPAVTIKHMRQVTVQ